MRYKQKQKGYCILRDPHLLYYLQSATKIKQLLNSGLYELNGNKLIHL